MGLNLAQFVQNMLTCHVSISLKNGWAEGSDWICEVCKILRCPFSILWPRGTSRLGSRGLCGQDPCWCLLGATLGDGRSDPLRSLWRKSWAQTSLNVVVWIGVVEVEPSRFGVGRGAPHRWGKHNKQEKRKEKKRQGQIKKSQRLYKRVELYQRLVTCLSSGESELHTAFLTSFDR